MKGILLRALDSGMKLEMIYISNNNEITYRTIKVLSVEIDSFKAYCYLRKKQRTFVIKNILSIGPERLKYNKDIS
ncbi:hypothetical protein AN964_14320 [Heyndrickxia shackletonii]|uniref:WYL domain-containing protein n=1 Tax=Heyndrickxia shackletonii TaxID=157838 RepID=A0A0Q3TLJ2_9BACI|nr:hypothetical protein [Heyndrickxia shackletonii]KQL54553.1 hypothetical protein AN964_14320 [Heyndrickxia shackletonii]MBB2478584.1 hypothetical protein [Bacillus sp. APMAM]NEZ02444.1 hypothetical protein [Heyndrickxia shackletonii]RTZ57730.1 hypothetical protein EKO25_00020 [Bacillus sp. SAJ1]